MKTQQAIPYSSVYVIFIFVFAIACAGGWVWNIVKLVNIDSTHITGMLIGRVVGIFLPPLGAVLGYL